MQNIYKMSARELLEEMHEVHFQEEQFDRLPTMSTDERKDYMLMKLNQMVCVDYEAPTDMLLPGTLEMFEMFKNDREALSSMMPWDLPPAARRMMEMQILRDPCFLWAMVWKNAEEEEKRPGCPFWDEKRMVDLTADELQQIKWLKDYTFFLCLILGNKPFCLEDLIPGMVSPDDEDISNWEPWHDFNFYDDGALEHFIRTTPYQRLAASLAFTVVKIAIEEAKSESKRNPSKQMRQKAKELYEFLKSADMTWTQCSAGFMPSKQFINRMHAIMHTAEIDYELNTFLPRP